MNLEAQLTALRNQSANLTLAERAELSCRIAKQLEKIGEYEAAREVLAEFWPDRNGPPKLNDLNESTKAEVLLRAGALAGWLGGADQNKGSQETAKNLITRGIEIFEELGQSEGAAEARGELALCYWREGSYDEARIHLAEALSGLGDENSELKAVLLIRAGIVEVDTQRFDQAIRFYNEANPLVEGSQDHALKGGFHIAYGLVFRRLATPENREDYMDRALIEYAAASFHFEEAGNERALARVENNLGYLFFTIGRYKEAHGHLDRAHHLFLKLKDVGTAAQVDDTRARTLLAQGHVAEAERLVRSAVRVLERGDQQAVLAEALTTQGVALARLGNRPRAKVLLERAIEVAETAGDLEGAGRAKLSIIEEFGDKIPAKELVAIYRSAIELLKYSQDPSTGKRLIACADKLLDTVRRLDGEDQESQDHTWEGFSFNQHVRNAERVVIERALRDAGGSVTRAARLLGFRHHQSLISIINSRHKELLTTRSTVRKRRRHLFSTPRKIKKKVVEERPKPTTSEISILHVEDNKVVARLIQDTLSPNLSVDQLIPKEILGIQCDVIEARYEPHGLNSRVAFDPIRPGISVGNLPRQSTGTLGLGVFDSNSGGHCILSNWHVLCGSVDAQNGKDDISQPGPQHLGSDPPRVIGQLLRSTDLSHGYDAAVCLLASNISLENEALGSDLTPVGIGEPTINMRLVKSGLSTNVTHALVDGLDGTYRMDYTGFGDAVRWMDGIHLVSDPSQSDAEISLEGDSGSVWIDPNNRLVTALHFGGEDGLGPLANYAVAHRMSRVFELLDIRLTP